jgi:hypothetical protein
MGSMSNDVLVRVVVLTLVTLLWGINSHVLIFHALEDQCSTRYRNESPEERPQVVIPITQVTRWSTDYRMFWSLSVNVRWYLYRHDCDMQIYA